MRISGMSLIPRIVMRFAVLATLPFAGPASCTDFPPGHYSAEAIEARVIDAGTNKPLEGVIVVAHWQLYEGGVAGRTLGPQLMVLETVTDKDGKFSLPAWGPIPRPTGYLDERSPELLLFKPGYEYQSLANPVRTEADHSAVRRSVWDGKTVGLKRYVDRLVSIGPHKYETSAYAEHLSSLSTSLESVASDGCNWKRMPRMLLTLKAQKDLFRKKGIRFSLIGSDYLPTDVKKCGAPDEFFEKYQP